MSFVMRPKVLLIDELSLGLAPVIVGQMLPVVQRLAASGVTVVLVEQSVNVALTVAQRAYFLERGEIRFSGPTAELLNRPDILRSVFLSGASAGESAHSASPVVTDSAIVLSTDQVIASFGGVRAVDSVSIEVHDREIVGVIGPNGAGKTTLFRMITGAEKPDKGTIKIGESVHLGYVDQSRDALDGKKNVWEEISGGNDQILLGKKEVNSRAYCSAFNFKGADQQKKVGSLSGGERNRVHLAKMLKSGANLLLLDEPTNDLDVDTLRALEEALEDFAGCAVIISHDRWFLDRIATHILAFEGDSHVEWFEGNFQDYEKDKMRRLGTDSVIPHRIKYKKFSR